MIRVLIVATLALWVPNRVLAETLYVTDKLYLALYATESAAGKPLASLVSGTPLDVLRRGKNYARVRLPDGRQGWTKIAYLVAEKPPRLVLEQLREHNQRLDQQVNTMRATMAAERASGIAQRRQTQAAVQRAAADTNELKRLRSENQRWRDVAAERGIRIPISWFAVSIAATALLAFWLGWLCLDRRIRMRHGGFRIY